MALTQMNKNGKPLRVLLVMAITSRKGRGGGGGRDSPGTQGQTINICTINKD